MSHDGKSWSVTGDDPCNTHAAVLTDLHKTALRVLSSVRALSNSPGDEGPQGATDFEAPAFIASLISVFRRSAETFFTVTLTATDIFLNGTIVMLAISRSLYRVRRSIRSGCQTNSMSVLVDAKYSPSMYRTPVSSSPPAPSGATFISPCAYGGKAMLRTATTSIAACAQPHWFVRPGGLNRSPNLCVITMLRIESIVGMSGSGCDD